MQIDPYDHKYVIRGWLKVTKKKKLLLKFGSHSNVGRDLHCDDSSFDKSYAKSERYFFGGSKNGHHNNLA